MEREGRERERGGRERGEGERKGREREEEGRERGGERGGLGKREKQAANAIPLPLLYLLDNTVASALLSLFWGQCSYYTPHGIFFVQFWNDAVFGFESDEVYSDDISLWQAWNGDAPVVVRNESLCGRSSLYLRQGRTRVFDLETNSNLA